MNDSTGSRGSPLGLFPGQSAPRLYDCPVEALRARHYSRRTERAYVHWTRRFLLFHNGVHPREWAAGEVHRFLTQLAVQGNVAAATRNQALAAVLFLYEYVLEQPLDRIEGVIRARKPKHLPVVLTPEEAGAVLAPLEEIPSLVSNLQYGAGLRVLDGLRLRVKDLDLGRHEITVRDGEGRIDRMTRLPELLHQPLQGYLRRVREQHEDDLGRGLGRAPAPDALARKCRNADREWGRQWVFPASSHYVDRCTGVQHRHHLHESVIQKGLHEAARRAGVVQCVTTHTFRHASASIYWRTAMTSGRFRSCWGISVQTTMIYTHVLNRGGRGVRSPVDRLRKPPSVEKRAAPTDQSVSLRRRR